MMGGDGAKPALGEATALRIRRLELDIEDLRAENARLKGSIAQRQDEIADLQRGLTDTLAVSEARAGVLWPVRAVLRRLSPKPRRRA